MYYYNSKPTELETMLLEFLEFKKSNAAGGSKSQKAPISPEIGRGWPHYKGYAAALRASTAEKPHNCTCVETTDTPSLPNSSTGEILGFVPIPLQPQELSSQPAPWQAPPQPAESSPRFPNPIGYSAPERHAHKEYDLDYAHQLMGSIASALMPHITEALNEQEFPGSPIFEDYLYRERLHQMIDQVLSRASADNPKIAELTASQCSCLTTSHIQLLRALIEVMIISELFLRRRPIYRKLIDLGWNPHEPR